MSAQPPKAPSPSRVSVVLGGVEHRLTMKEWTTLMVNTNAQWAALRVKCPTCRCKILPNGEETCWCCSGSRCESGEVEDPEPFV